MEASALIGDRKTRLPVLTGTSLTRAWGPIRPRAGPSAVDQCVTVRVPVCHPPRRGHLLRRQGFRHPMGAPGRDHQPVSIGPSDLVWSPSGWSDSESGSTSTKGE